MVRLLKDKNTRYGMREHVRSPQLTKKKTEWVAMVDTRPRPKAYSVKRVKRYEDTYVGYNSRRTTEALSLLSKESKAV